MAERLDSYDFTIWQREMRKPDRYPWPEWTNGEIWRVVPGEDFRGKPLSFRTNLYNKARKLGLTVETHIQRDDRGEDVAVVFRFGKKV